MNIWEFIKWNNSHYHYSCYKHNPPLYYYYYQISRNINASWRNTNCSETKCVNTSPSAPKQSLTDKCSNMKQTCFCINQFVSFNKASLLTYWLKMAALITSCYRQREPCKNSALTARGEGWMGCNGMNGANNYHWVIT